MKRNKYISKSVEDENNNSFLDNTFTRRNEIKKTPRITYQNNLKTNYNSSSSSFIIMQDEDNKYIIEKTQTQQIPKSNFLEEMYFKYSKNLQKYFLKNQTGLKLIGNKYFQNLTVEEYIKKNKLNKEQFIQLLNGEAELNNKNLENIKKEQFFLTPLPNKSRQLLNTNKEKSDFLEAERAAVVMRTFEYTHGIRSKVGIYEYKKILMEQKQKLINLMLNAAKKIQRWWKKKYYYISRNKSENNFRNKLLIYSDMLNRKKLKIFYDKVYNLVKYLLKQKRKLFLKKLKNKAKNSIKKIYSIYDWINSMEIFREIELEIIDNSDLYFIKKKNLNINKNIGFISNYYISKKIIFSKKADNRGINTEDYQIKQIILIQKIFKHHLKLKKETETFRNSVKSQFSYINPNKILFLFNKNANSEAKISKSYSKTKNNNIDSKNNYINKKDKNLIEEDKEITTRKTLPSISPLSKNKEANDDNEKNNYELRNKKCVVENLKKLNMKKNGNNFVKIDLNKANNARKKLNSNFKCVNEIIRYNNNIGKNKKNSRNKSANNSQSDKSKNKDINLNKSNSRLNKKVNNDNKNNFKIVSPDKQKQKSSTSNSKEFNQNNKNNSSFISNIIDSKKKKKNNLSNVNINKNNKKINNSRTKEFYFNSSSYINKQISFGVDNAPSEITEKNNINSFYDNENINNNSSLNNYYNLNNNIENQNKAKIHNYKKIKTLKNQCIPQKIPLINNLLSIEENELNLVNKNNNNKKNNKNHIENKNNLLLIDSLEIENSKKIDKNLINVINSNENFEKSLPPEINLDNYQQDSTLDYRDKKLKSNQKTISTSAIFHLDTSNNQINHELNYNFQIFGQICLGYIHRPCIIPDNDYISKIRKKVFSSKINKNLINLIKIKESFTLNKLLLNNNINKYIIMKKYLKKWKNITDKENTPYTYSKVITSICTMENNDKEEYFSYYCKINKSNQENDFIFLRISLGYKLLRKVFCGNDLKIFFYILKRRHRRKNKSKTYIYKKHSKNILNLLDFKIKLPILLNKILIKKYCELFYHKFLYFSLSLNNNIEYDLDNNNVCFLVREGYKKGYFKILYNVLKERFNYEFYNTGLKFETFTKKLLTLHE